MPAWVEDPFAASVVAPLSLIAASYTPDSQWTGTRQTARVYRGSGVPIRFSPPSPTTVTAGDYEATLGVIGSDTFETYSVALGNMTVDEDTGDITVNPTEAQTLALSLTERTALDLWRTDTDDTRTVVGRLYLTVVETNNP